MAQTASNFADSLGNVHQPGPPERGNTQQNHERVLVRLVREACRALNVDVRTLGEGWIVRLTAPDGRVRHVHGYCFDLNPAATHQICCDKAATCEVLTAAGVSCVEHRLVLHPDMARYVPHQGTWTNLLKAFEVWHRDVVIKDNTGTGGRGVSRCRGVVELERAVYALFERVQAVAVCPFVEIAHEYRFVMLQGACELAYEKVRARVTGDGRSSVLDLISAQHALRGPALGALLESLSEEERAALAQVPAAGEARLLNWRHNLGQGASARVVALDTIARDQAWELAHRAAAQLGLVFGSVDVVVDSVGQRRVLEVNSGVMMEFLVRTLPEGESMARRVYERAVRAMLP